MSDINKKFEHLIPIIQDKIRVLQMEIVDMSEVTGYWTYKIAYVMDDEIKEEHVMGKDMSDALYRLGKILEMPLTRFPSYLKG